MGYFKDHAQAIADKEAIDIYGTEFQDLPDTTQAELIEQGIEQAQNELTLLVERE